MLRALSFAVVLFAATAQAQTIPELRSQGPVPSAAEASSPPQPETAAAQEKTDSDQRGTATVPLIVKTLPAEDYEARAAEERADREQHAAYERWLVIFTGVLSLFTLILAVSTIALWLETRGLRRLTIEEIGEMKVSVAAARVSAEAAQKSANAVVSMERGRVHLEIKHDNIDKVVHAIADKRQVPDMLVQFSFKNYGKTPAIIKEISFALEHWSEMGEPNYSHLEDIRSHYALGPNDSTPDKVARLSIPLDQVAAENVKVGDVSIWFYGRVVYDDVFDDEHVTPFWWRYAGRVGGFSQWGGTKWNKRT